MDIVTKLITEQAVDILLSGDADKGAFPMVFSPGDDQMIIIPVEPFPEGDTSGKVVSFGLAFGVARALGSKRLLVITDTWYTEMTDEEAKRAKCVGGYTSPSKSFNRQEALLLSDSTELGVRHYMLKYSRDGDDKPVIGEWEEMPKESDGVIVGLLKTFTDSDDPDEDVVEGARQLAQDRYGYEWS